MKVEQPEGGQGEAKHRVREALTMSQSVRYATAWDGNCIIMIVTGALQLHSFRRCSTGTQLQNHPWLSIDGEDPVGPFCGGVGGVLECSGALRITCNNELSS